MTLKLITPPADLPVTVEEVQRHTRIDFEDDDLLLETYITAATVLLDGKNGILYRALRPQTWELQLDCFPRNEIELPLIPVIEVESVGYLDASGAEQTIDAAQYIVDADGARVSLPPGGSWPVTYKSTNAARIRYVAGYPDMQESDPATSTVPMPLKLAIMIMAADWYENREPDPAAKDQLPMAVRLLIEPYIVPTIA